jgi:outer membrane protein assembly factor BamB
MLVMALAMALSMSAAHAAEGEYARFLPNDGNDVYPAKNLLRQWPAGGPKQLWRKEIGLGKSTVVEAGGRAFTCTQLDMKQYAVCLDLKTGETIWKTMISPKDNHHQVKGPEITPVVDGDRVYCIPYENNNGDIYDIRCPVWCLRTSDGSVVWRGSETSEPIAKVMAMDNKTPQGGTANEPKDWPFVSTEGSTPLIVGDTLYVGSNGRQSVLVAVDKYTGKIKWKTPEPNDTGHPSIYGAGSSLTYQVVQGIPQIIVSVYRNDNMGVNAQTGEAMWHWRFPTPFSSGMVSTPVAVGDKLFMSGFQGPSAWGVCFDMKVVDGKTSQHGLS